MEHEHRVFEINFLQDFKDNFGKLVSSIDAYEKGNTIEIKWLYIFTHMTLQSLFIIINGFTSTDDFLIKGKKEFEKKYKKGNEEKCEKGGFIFDNNGYYHLNGRCVTFACDVSDKKLLIILDPYATHEDTYVIINETKILKSQLNKEYFLNIISDMRSIISFEKMYKNLYKHSNHFFDTPIKEKEQYDTLIEKLKNRRNTFIHPTGDNYVLFYCSCLSVLRESFEFIKEIINKAKYLHENDVQYEYNYIVEYLDKKSNP